MRNIPLIGYLITAVWLSSCCEPAHKDSQPVVVDSMFQESYGRDLDIFTQSVNSTPIADSAYFPIYTLGIKNSGSQDDDFTLSLRYTNIGFVAGFDITKHVPAGATILFQTPSPMRDSSATYFYPNFTNAADTNPTMDKAYYAIQASTSDSVEIHTLRPTLTITSGAIDNGPEACNTPASQMTIDINELPKRY